MVIAIDYDETITDNTPFPYEGKIRPECYSIIPKLFEQGYTLVLWTARKEPYYTECVKRLEKEGLMKYFTPISELDVGPTGKIQADIYVDDRSRTSILDLGKEMET